MMNAARRVIRDAREQAAESFEWEPNAAYHMPEVDDSWTFGVFAGSRGAGKSYAVARHLYDHMNGPPCDPTLPGGHQALIVGPSLADVRRGLWDAPSGLSSLPGCRWTTRAGGTVIEFPSGSEGRCIGVPTERQIENTRAAGNTCIAVIEEAGSIVPLKAMIDVARFGVRMGPFRKWLISGTPRPRAGWKWLINHPRSVVMRGRLADNPHVPQAFIDEMYAEFGGTRMGRQELEGEEITDVEGALWTLDQLDTRRIMTADLEDRSPREPTETREEWLTRVLGLEVILVGVDPATSGRGDETGIIVAGFIGLGRKDSQMFVLEDATYLAKPSEWRQTVVECGARWGTIRYVTEENRLGETAELLIQDATSKQLKIHTVHAGSGAGKAMRADPVEAAWTRRCWIVDHLPKLENQMTSWVPADGDRPDSSVDATMADAFRGSPDALDAMVWVGIKGLGLTIGPKKASTSMIDDYTSGW